MKTWKEPEDTGCKSFVASADKEELSQEQEHRGLPACFPSMLEAPGSLHSAEKQPNSRQCQLGNQ